MGTSPGLIDLGVYSYRVGPEQLPELERAGPASARPRRWVPVVLVLALLWPLAAAAAAPAQPLARLWTAPDGSGEGRAWAVGDSDLYTAARTDDGLALTAYRLADGSVRWQTPLDAPSRSAWPSQPDQVQANLFDGVLLVHSYDLPAHTAAFDPETARLRWTGYGYPEPIGAGLVVLYAPGRGPAGARAEIRDLDNGALVMSLGDTTERLAHQVSPDGTVQLVGLARDGVLTSYDVSAGTVLRRGATPHEEQLLASYQNGVSIVDDLVLVSHHPGGESELAAYDLETLTPMWTVSGGSYAESCGPVVCVSTVAPGGRPNRLRGIDPATGTSRWSVGCADFGIPGDCLLRTWGLVSDGRLLVLPSALEPEPDEPNRQVIIDTASGRPVTVQTGWNIVAWPDTGLLLSRAEDPDRDGSGNLREVAIPPHRIWWARSDFDLERIEVLGAIDADGCTPHDPYLVCHTDGARFEVWRFAS